MPARQPSSASRSRFSSLLRPRVGGSLLVAGSALALAACAPEFDTSKSSSPRGTLGQEVFTVLCERLAADELREDLTGASFRSVCLDGQSDTVDVSALPALIGGAKNAQGEALSLEEQEAARHRAVRRIETFAQKRERIVAAIDAAVPDRDMLVRTLEAKPNASGDDQSCTVADQPGNVQTELAGLLSRFGNLYVDGTVPDATRAIGETVAAFRDDPEARAAWGRLATREGYRPASVALGLVRPFAAYPRLRELLSSLVAVASADSRPYEEIAGQHIQTPGPAYPQFRKLLEVARHELKNSKADVLPAPLQTRSADGAELTQISRPRDNLELLQSVMLAEDEQFGGGQPRFIVRRDNRGLARLSASAEGSGAFVDADGDGLPDTNDLGAFLTTNSQAAPTPFWVPGKPQSIERDAFGRALIQNQLAYSYINTSNTFTASLLAETRPLFNPNPAARHETMMDALAGLYLVAGDRIPQQETQKRYADGSVVSFRGIDRARSPLLDLGHAATQLLAEPAFDDALVLSKKLVESHESQLARVVKATLEAGDLAHADAHAQLRKDSPLWDDLFDLVARMAEEPGLLEAMLDAFTDPDTERLGELLGKWAIYKDDFSYSRVDVSGPAVNVTAPNGGRGVVTLVDPNRPDSGENRSMLQRFLQLMHDGYGVTACNREHALVYARAFGFDVTMPLTGTYKECEVYKINDLDTFLLQSMVGSPKATLRIRDSALRNGQVAGLGKATVGLMEDSAGVTGFYTDRSSTDLRPRPEWLARKVFFDVDENPGPNGRTQKFILNLNGSSLGSSVCEERVITDPCSGGACNFGGDVSIPNDVATDGKVRGLRNCKPGESIRERNPNTLFMMEALGAYQAFAPLARAFVDRDREDLFIELAVLLHKHWQSDAGTAAECALAKGEQCSKSNTSSYQPLLGEMLARDTLPAVIELTRAAKAMRVQHCTALGSDGNCTASEERSGLQVLADTTRTLFSRKRAATVDLRDRKGGQRALRNDGKDGGQLTPVYLLTDALKTFDDAYDRFDQNNPGNTRRAQFRSARSQLADQLLAVDGSGQSAQFRSRGLVRVLPTVIELMRQQTWANCPKTFGNGDLRCRWAREELPAKLEEAVTGPLFTTFLDFADALRADPRARAELQHLIQYLMDAASQNDALPALLASASDVVQLLRDDANLVPFYRVLATALAPSEEDGGRKGVVDASLSLLGKVAGRYENEVEGGRVEQICSREIDPNQVLNVLLATLVTPTETLQGEAPIEVLLDLIADVSRVAPETEKPHLDAADYAAIADSVHQFLTNETRGLEQFYEIVRKGIETR